MALQLIALQRSWSLANNSTHSLGTDYEALA